MQAVERPQQQQIIVTNTTNQITNQDVDGDDDVPPVVGREIRGVEGLGLVLGLAARQGHVRLDQFRRDDAAHLPVDLHGEVGRAQMSVGKLLRLSQGSVVELDRNAGEPLDVLVNGALVAHGEIVIINDKFGIRLTDIVTPSERMRRLSKL